MSRNPRASTSAETNRALADLVRDGVVESIDLDAGKAIVRLGDILTPPCDWSMSVGDTTIWNPPTVGQPVIIICPEGDIERAYISSSLPSSQMAPLFMGAKVAIRFKDGSLLSYDPDASELRFELIGKAALVVPDGLSIEADVAITGNVSLEGDLTGTGTLTGQQDVIGAGKSLKSHKHTGVTAGSAVSGAPQ